MEKPLEVTQRDSPLRYFVRSEADPEKDPYETDLGEWSCTCKNFKCKLEPLQVKNWDNRTSSAYTCKHLRESFSHFAFLMRDTILDMYHNKSEND